MAKRSRGASALGAAPEDRPVRKREAMHRMERRLETCRACFSQAEFERRLRERVAETGSAPAPQSLRLRIRALIGRF